jgi:hypothetical protein
VKKSRQNRARRLEFETLERREVLAAGVTASLDALGVLRVVGTDGADQILFKRASGMVSINDVAGAWSSSSVKSIVVDLRGGNDHVSLDSIANGGTKKLNEKVSILSGAGNEDVALLNGATVRFAGVGHKLDVASSGKAAHLNGAALNFTPKVTAKSSSGVLTITGTNGDDNIQLRQKSGRISIVGLSGSWRATSVKSIVIYLQDGNDSVSLDSLANGGTEAIAESITIHSGNGSETIHLANGHDIEFSGLGHVLHVSEAGTVTLDGETLTWEDPAPQPDPDPDPEPEPEPDPDPNPDPPAANWFTTNIQDAALRSLGSSLYTDSLIDRNDMISLLLDARDGGSIDSTELNDLRSIVANTGLFAGLEHVWTLSSYIVNGNVANAKYQGQTLGNLAAGASATQMDKLVNKWFFGLDRPTAGGTYRQFAGSLFVNGVAYSDIRQGAVGDCYFVATLAEAALRSPNAITSMFIVNGDGTYTTRFFNSGQPAYVTVDSFLPTNSTGKLIYASRGQLYSNAGNELWVALAEKAYVQANEMGWVRPGLPGSGQNAYSGIEGGYIYAAMRHVTGQSTVAFTMTSNSTSFNTFVTAWNSGKSIGFASYVSPPAGSGVVGSHAYAVVGYNATNQTVTLFNPWGMEYGLLTLSWSQIQASFQYFDRTA